MMDVSRMADNCPYCGGRPVMFNREMKTIECESCCEMSVSFETFQGAINKWNSNVMAVKEMRAESLFSEGGAKFDV